jgi:hypothetical protein
MSSADGGTVTWKTLVAGGRTVNEFSSLKIFSNFDLSGGFLFAFQLAPAAVLELGDKDIKRSAVFRHRKILKSVVSTDTLETELFLVH